MKKIMILMAGALLAGSASQAQITIAPEVGLNLANWHVKEKDATTGNTSTTNGDLKVGVKVGANVNIPIGDNLMIQPGLFYSLRGTKLNETNSGISTSENITLHYFDIPVNVQYNFNDPDEGRFFIGVGPYVGIAFKGKNKYSGGGFSGTEDLKFGNDKGSNDLERFEFGAQGYAGYMLKSGIFFRAMYQLGITNLESQAPSGYSTKSTNITVSIGYNIGG